ncbi:hypothetical protein UPYG_G00032330 [Umbra pygmaea]|uniref:Centromere protein R n=1 Tax=Umbra pygmaea TaxID=75934 RepID=A0ABD0XQF8_UMBPY
MPVKRALGLDGMEKTPVKKTAQDRNYSPITGTCQLSSITSPPAAGKARASGINDNSQKPQGPQTEVEELHAIRSKLEGSVGAFFKARRKLEEIVAAESSSELETFFRRGSAELTTELRRHQELTSQAESCLRATGASQRDRQGMVQTGSSNEFLKSIMGL